MFRTPYNFEDDVISCSGSLTVDINSAKNTGEAKCEYGYEYTYKEIKDKQGRRNLVISGRKNIYDKIQSYKDDVDIYKILDRYMAGDLSVLDRNKGFYMDFTSIPKTFDEYQNKISEGKRIFDSLPVDFKSEFGQNVDEFMHSIYDKSFERRYNDYVSRVTNRSRGNIANNVNNNINVGLDNNVNNFKDGIDKNVGGDNNAE